MNCFFVTDLHGNVNAFSTLFQLIIQEKPELVFIGGDLLSGGFLRTAMHNGDMLTKVIGAGFDQVRRELGDSYPQIFIIMGNDDPKSEESLLLRQDKQGLWHYINQRHIRWQNLDIYGYSWVPPTPFHNKDWERYDVSRYVDIGCLAPEEGYHTTPVVLAEVQNRTIKEDLQELAGSASMSRAVWLFHSPPYNTGLDRAPLDGKMIDYVPLDVHVGSIAIREFIEEHQPLVTLHGHVHESYELTGIWKEKLGRTVCLSAASTGKALTLVRFNTEEPDAAQRTQIS